MVPPGPQLILYTKIRFRSTGIEEPLARVSWGCGELGAVWECFRGLRSVSERFGGFWRVSDSFGVFLRVRGGSGAFRRVLEDLRGLDREGFGWEKSYFLWLEGFYDGGVGAVVKIFASQSWGPRFNSRPGRGLNIRVAFFPAKVRSAFHPHGVGKMSTSIHGLIWSGCHLRLYMLPIRWG